MVLTKLPHDPLLDLDPWVGQRSASFKFRRFNGVTGEVLPELHPIREGTLTHDTKKTIKRQLSLPLGVLDSAAINPISDRIDLYMTFRGSVEYPLGRYMFTDQSRRVYQNGELAQVVLNDEMFLVDQQIEFGISAAGTPIDQAVKSILDPLPINFTVDSSEFSSGESWGIGAFRGSVLEALATSGDYFSPWFGHDHKLHFVRTFDPAMEIPDLDFDNGNKVIREGIIASDELLTAPNLFIVTSNIDNDAEVVGRAEVPPGAPHSFANRGFYIVKHEDMQLTSSDQASAVATGLMIRQTIFETVTLNTAPDPRHDSYNVIQWRGEKWLELAWSMQLAEGGAMSHYLRRAYR